MEDRVERRVCGVSGDGGVLCKFVRTSSSGEAIVVINVRAVIPEVRGTMDAGRSEGYISLSR